MLTPTERRVLSIGTFISACLCLAPGEVVSGGALLVGSVALYLWDRRQLRREEAQAKPPSAEATLAQPAPE